MAHRLTPRHWSFDQPQQDLGTP